MHKKIKELQKRAQPINYNVYVNKEGVLVDDRTIGGYLTVWGVRDSYGTIFVKGCCSKSLQERGVNSNANYKITMLWQHEQRDPIGRFIELEEDDYGLRFKAVLDEGVENADRALVQLRSGTLNQFSIGFNYIWDKVEYDEKTDSLLLKEISLMEGSVVTIGAVEGTYAFRSMEEYDERLLSNKIEIEHFIKSLPVGKRIEARHLFAEASSLSRHEPNLNSLRDRKPNDEGIDYKYLIENFKLS